VATADIVVTATPAAEPILQAGWLRPGTHLCVVGSSHPRMREVDSDTVVGSRVFVDSREAAAVEAGDLLIPLREGRWDLDSVVAELGDVASGAPGRGGPGEITLFKSLGLGVEDVASAALALRRARELGLGSPLNL
jgi:ornithine cyclodeaminase/alanine dehydrogenase-like protein (mu-crystallin family)